MSKKIHHTAIISDGANLDGKDIEIRGDKALYNKSSNIVEISGNVFFISARQFWMVLTFIFGLFGLWRVSGAPLGRFGVPLSARVVPRGVQ